MHARPFVACPSGRLQSARGEPRGSSSAAIFLLLTAVCTAADSSSPAAAGTIYWNMEALAATSNGVAGLTAGALTRGQGGGTSITGTVSSSGGYTFILNGTSNAASGGNNAQSSAVGGSLSTGSSAYFGFMLTNQSAYAMTMEGLGFGSRSTGTGPTGYALRTSLDGYATDVAGATGSLPTNSTWAYYANTITTPLLIASGSSLEARIYGWGGSAANLNNVTWRIDDLQVVVVPEPAAAMLAVGAVVGCVVACLRKRPGPVSPPSRT